MKRDNADSSSIDRAKRCCQEEQRNSFAEDHAEIHALLNPHHEPVVENAENEVNLPNSTESVGMNVPRKTTESGCLLQQKEKSTNEEGLILKKLKSSSIDEDEENTRIWLAPPQTGSSRRHPRIGNDFQASLPSTDSA